MREGVRVKCTVTALSVMFVFASAEARAREDNVPPVDSDEVVYSSGNLGVSEASLSKIRKAPIHRAFLPEATDLSLHFPPAGDQGDQGSCVGWAVGYAARAYYVASGDGLDLASRSNVPSPAYIYNRSLVERGLTDCDSGMAIPDAFEMLKAGAASLAEMPYLASSCSGPRPVAIAAATRFRIKDYDAIPPSEIDTVKGELAKGNPIVFSMPVGRRFMRHRGSSVYAKTAAQDRNVVSHAMVILGYDERRQAFRIQNSWGRAWGDYGRAWLSYDLFRNEGETAFVMRPIGNSPRPVLPPTPAPRPALVDPQPISTPPAPALVVDDSRPTPSPIAPTTFAPPQLSLACSKLTFSKAGDVISVKGFVASVRDLDPIKAALGGQQSRIEVDVRPWPQCETLLTLEKALAANDRPAIALANGRAAFIKGEPLILEVTAPQRSSHLHVSYIQADGSVVHLIQADASNLKTYDGGARVTFGDGVGGRPAFKASPPFGEELVVAIASRSPIFASSRPQLEKERDFLSALRRALLWKSDPAASERDVSAAFVSISTKEQ